MRQLDSAPESGEFVSLGREGVGGIQTFPERSLDRRRYRYVKGPKDAKVARLFVLGDSFIEKSFFYFAAHAKELYGYREILGFPFDVMEKLAPELVLHTIVEGYLLIEPPKNSEKVRQAYRRIQERTGAR
jgi:hypothetical protein